MAGAKLTDKYDVMYAGQIYEGPSFIQLNTIAKCMDDEYKNQ